MLDLAWGADGKTLFYGSFDNVVGACDVASGKVLWHSPSFGYRHASCLSLSPATGRAITGTATGTATVWTPQTQETLLTFAFLPNRQHFVVHPTGHYRGSPRVERMLVYVVQTEAGQETLTPAEFTERYGWQNDPSRVRLGEN